MIENNRVATNRLEILEQMVQQDPSNSFARYGFAMELVNNGRLEEALRQFHALLEKAPNYSAAYYHGGQVSERLNRIEEARDFYEKGIEVTTRTGDGHTRAEIEAALSLLPI